MIITSTNKRVLKDGTVRGTITVADGKRRHRVQFEQTRNGHAEQWGAPTEVLCRTYATFERMIGGAS